MLRPGVLLGAQGLAPFVHEIPAEHQRPVFDGVQRRSRMDRRRDAHRKPGGDAGTRPVEADTQGEIAAQGESDHEEAAVAIELLRCPHRAQHLIDAGRMEGLAVQAMGAAMVAQVEAEDVVAGRIQRAGHRVEVGGLVAALPAVDQQRQAQRHAVLRLARVEAGEAHAVAAVQFMAARHRLHAAAAPQPQPAPRALGGEDRLQLRMADQQRRAEARAVHSNSSSTFS